MPSDVRGGGPNLRYVGLRSLEGQSLNDPIVANSVSRRSGLGKLTNLRLVCLEVRMLLTAGL